MPLVPAASDRFVLRPWRPDDADALFAIRSRPEVARWMEDTTPWTDRSQAEETIARWTDLLGAEDGLGVWAIVPVGADEPVGSVSLKPLPNGDGEVEIGWQLHPDAWGHGYAREAAALVLAHGFALGLPRVWAVMWPGNEPSARVCRAIGMADLGVLSDPWYGGESHTFRA